MQGRTSPTGTNVTLFLDGTDRSGSFIHILLPSTQTEKAAWLAEVVCNLPGLGGAATAGNLAALIPQASVRKYHKLDG